VIARIIFCDEYRSLSYSNNNNNYYNYYYYYKPVHYGSMIHEFCLSLCLQLAYEVPSKWKLPNHIWGESVCAQKLKVLAGPFLITCRDSTLSVMTKLQDGRYGICIPARARDSSLHPNVHTGSGTQQGSYSIRTECKAAGA
jgi:hypothetical protein